MRVFHRHRWAEHARTFAPPAIRIGQEFGAEGLGDAALERMLNGTTTFVFRCTDPTCADFKTVVALGAAVDDPLERMVR